ncbi:MAG TPA: ABC transporter ATP-binding protein [Geminicoccaceae bacterium]|mgnify:CR=1 FL=1|nr:ABC transporter ATP-binding protein [Geminicoccaceae bacterium]
MLAVHGLEAAYGATQVLFGVSLEVGEGRIVGLLGRNGMGKTTLIRSLYNLTRRLGGSVRFEGEDLDPLPPFAIARRGIAVVPEGRQIFPGLSVEENLVATARPGEWRLGRVLDLFPRLAERRRNPGGSLSGGEQQMLAIGRALLTNPRLLVLDEATEGLAPAVRREIWQCIRALKATGIAILLVDPHLGRLLELTDTNVIIENGRSVWQGSSAELADRPALQRRYLAV